jgi:hypothetical protein
MSVIKLHVKVREGGGTYHAAFAACFRASDSSGAAQAAVRLARKIYPSDIVDPGPERADAGETIGRTEWIVTVKFDDNDDSVRHVQEAERRKS